ncbi:MAG: hypothetical protein M0T79_09720 [Actinomycetota bacterium]|nr:hypothetical protein [Actinomycetota bacterium]
MATTRAQKHMMMPRITIVPRTITMIAETTPEAMPAVVTTLSLSVRPDRPWREPVSPQMIAWLMPGTAERASGTARASAKAPTMPKKTRVSVRPTWRGSPFTAPQPAETDSAPRAMMPESTSIGT